MPAVAAERRLVDGVVGVNEPSGGTLIPPAPVPEVTDEGVGGVAGLETCGATAMVFVTCCAVDMGLGLEAPKGEVLAAMRAIYSEVLDL